MPPPSLHDFPRVWLVDAECGRRPGGRPALLGPARVEDYRTGEPMADHCGLAPCPANDLVVAFDGPLVFGALLAAGVTLGGAALLNLKAEFLCLTNGTLPASKKAKKPADYTLADALAHLELPGHGPRALLDHYAGDLPATGSLERGRFGLALAVIEANGIPVERAELERVERAIQQGLADRMGWLRANYGIFDDAGRLLHDRLRGWARAQGIAWPARSGKALLDLKTLADLAGRHPQVRPILDFYTLKNRFRPPRLPVGGDGRARAPLRPYGTQTGRCAPPGDHILVKAAWARGLVQPRPGTVLVNLDFVAQDFGSAAARSADPAMLAAYRSGDAYLETARLAGAATPEEAARLRPTYKLVALGILNKMGAFGIQKAVACDRGAAQRLLETIEGCFPVFLAWREAYLAAAARRGYVESELGWRLDVRGRKGPKARRSLANFPVQAAGAEIQMLAAAALMGLPGVRVCGLLHDSALVEVDEDALGLVEEARRAMEEASATVLGGFRLEVKATVYRQGEKLLDDDGRADWEELGRLTDPRSFVDNPRSLVGVPSQSCTPCPLFSTTGSGGVGGGVLSLASVLVPGSGVGGVLGGLWLSESSPPGVGTCPPSTALGLSRPSSSPGGGSGSLHPSGVGSCSPSGAGVASSSAEPLLGYDSLFGPIPVDWLRDLHGLGGWCLTVGLALCYLRGVDRRKREWFPLESGLLGQRFAVEVEDFGRLRKTVLDKAGDLFRLRQEGNRVLVGLPFARRVKSLYFRGPLPLSQVRAVNREGRGPALAVLLAVWHQSYLRRGPGPHSPRDFAGPFGLTPSHLHRGLPVLEGLGLVKVVRAPRNGLATESVTLKPSPEQLRIIEARV